ncbi:type II secretion system minor pseudopilin GspK [Glaciecola sp. SC05]|uniref:type II secretion system minor pseudopilin GspK n=1 Tax=Glaciecola sp. SC05 TaxID=1987355 RepID=UPI0035271D8F
MNAVADSKQKGVALVVVLLIVALISILATQMISRLQLNVVRAQNIKDNNQAYWYALGAEEFARKSLSALVSLSPDNINLSQPWAQTFEYPVEGGGIKAELVDMQSCFNLNAINSQANSSNQNPDETDSEDESENEEEQSNTELKPSNPNGQTQNGRLPSQQAFHNLMDIIVDDSFVVDTVTDSLIDWIDEDDKSSDFGAEDVDYESLAIPYLAANNTMSSTSELRLINGVQNGSSGQWLNDLLPLVCVLPETSLRLNVNTITNEQAAVLAALLGDTLDNAQSIISNRPEEGFSKIEDFRTLPAVTALNLPANNIEWFAIDTKYFKLTTTTQYNDAQFRLTTLFYVGGGSVTVVRREFGGF